MASLSRHLSESDEHATLRFRGDCPICRDERLFGTPPSTALVSTRGTAAVLLAGALTTASAGALAGNSVAVAGAKQTAPAADNGPEPGDASDPGPGGNPGPEETVVPPAPGLAAGASPAPPPPPPPAVPEPAPAAPLPAPTPAPTPTPPQTPAPAPPPQPAAPAPPASALPQPAAPAPAPAPPQPASEPAIAPQPAPRPRLHRVTRPSRPGSDAAPTSSQVVDPAPSGGRAEQADVQGAQGGDRQAHSATPSSDGPAATKQRGHGHVHVVQRGESLWRIAEAYLARTGERPSPAQIARLVDRLWVLNRDSIRTGEANLIFPGTALEMP